MDFDTFFVFTAWCSYVILCICNKLRWYSFSSVSCELCEKLSTVIAFPLQFLVWTFCLTNGKNKDYSNRSLYTGIKSSSKSSDEKLLCWFLYILEMRGWVQRADHYLRISLNFKAQNLGLKYTVFVKKAIFATVFFS